MMVRRDFLQAAAALSLTSVGNALAQGTDPRQGFHAEHIASPIAGKRLNVIRGVSPIRPSQPSPVLYVHGGTFPAHLAVAWRFDGQSWMDYLMSAGFDVWGFDFLGFGDSDRYDEMALPATGGTALGRSRLAAEQIAAVVSHVLRVTGAQRIHVIAHSWGTQPAAIFAGQTPDLIDRLVLFGAILQRQPGAARLPDPDTLPAYSFITVDDQWKRFTDDVPKEHAPVMLERHFKVWSEAYLDTDSNSRSRNPAAVQTPLGPVADIAAAWRGHLSYDPGTVKAPTALIRGEWDSLCNDADAGWFTKAFTGTTCKLDIKIAEATHLMHLEASRTKLWKASADFLANANASSL